MKFKALSISFLFCFLVACSGPSSAEHLLNIDNQVFLPLTEEWSLNVTDLSVYNLSVSEGDTFTYIRFNYDKENLCQFDVRIDLSPGSFSTDAGMGEPEILSVVHDRQPGYEVPMDGGGHEWIVPGASTTIEAIVKLENKPISPSVIEPVLGEITIYCEYTPYLTEVSEAEARYNESIEEITELLTLFVPLPSEVGSVPSVE